MSQITRTVEITLEDMERGMAGHCFICPAALALQRTFPEVEKIGVVPREVSVTVLRSDSSLYTYRIPSPPDLMHFVEAYDHNDPCGPVAFQLTVEL